MQTPNAQERLDVAAAMIDDWAAALRGDWSSIDGRQCRSELELIARYLRGGDRPTRSDIGLCQCDNGSHWEGAGYCS